MTLNYEDVQRLLQHERTPMQRAAVKQATAAGVPLSDIVDIVRQQPGITTRELAAALGLRPYQLQARIDRVDCKQALRSTKDVARQGRARCWFIREDAG